MKITYLTPEKENWFLITWDLSNKCNYRCSYCPDILHNGSSGWPEYSEVINFIDQVNRLLPNKQICFRFSGGEPTYWNHFLKLAEYIKSKNNYFSFLTNGSRDVDYFRQINRYADGIILSYHPEYSTTDHFINIANVLDCPVAVNLMLLPDQFDSAVDIAKSIFDKSKAAVWPKIIVDKTAQSNNIKMDYTTEQEQLIKHWPYFRKLDDSKIHRGQLLLDKNNIDANLLILQEQNRYTNWKCWSGLHSLHVNAFGDVYRADCKQTNIGSIKEFTLPTSPDICKKDTCACLSDLYLRKEL